MTTALLMLMLALGLVFALGDTSADDAEPEDETPEDEMPPAELLGTPGDDLLVGDGGLIMRGLEGDDLMFTTGGDTMFGGPGNDTLVAVGGGATLFGGPDADVFVIELLHIGDDGSLLDLNGAPVPPTVIGDFNPDEDRLVIDLRGSPFDDTDAPVTLTGVLAPDGEGLMVQVDGVDVVQLATYGGGDMQAALEALATDFGALEVIGAAWTFPDSPLAGITSETDPETGAITFFMTEEFGSGPAAIDAGDLRGTLDLTQTARDLTIGVDDDGTLLIRDPLTDAEILRASGIERLILGEGTKTFDASGTNVAIAVEAVDGENTIIGGDGDDRFTVRGPMSVATAGTGVNTLIGSDGATLRGDNFGSDLFRVEVTLGDSGTPTQEPVIIESFGRGQDDLVINITYPADQDPPEVTTRSFTDPFEVHFLLGDSTIAILSGTGGSASIVPPWGLITNPV